MTIILGILFGFVAFCIIALVLLQESKGGGIAAMGVPGMDNIVGARNPLRKLTAIFSVIFLVLVLGIGVVINRQKSADVPEGLEVEADADAGADSEAIEIDPGIEETKPAADAAETSATDIAAEPAVPVSDNADADEAQSPQNAKQEQEKDEPKPAAGEEDES